MPNSPTLRLKYSGTQVSKAGKKLANHQSLSPEELSVQMDVLSYWRYCHEKPVNDAFKLLQDTVSQRDKSAIFAKRLKRYQSIIQKLQRFDSMSLKNMQDIAGCRAVLTSDKKLRQVVRTLKTDKRFRRANGALRAKDYIQSPKADGYRSYHMVGRFPDSDGAMRNVELQLRTFMQHYWATSLEIVDLFTGQALKSNQGDEDWHRYFYHVSEQFAAMDQLHLFAQLDPVSQRKKYLSELLGNKELIDSCLIAKQLSNKLGVRKKLEAFAGSLRVIDVEQFAGKDVGYFLLHINLEHKTVSVNAFSRNHANQAEQAYIAQEKQFVNMSSNVVALVSTTTLGDIKQAYPNFFADSTEFMQYLLLIERVEIARKPGVLERMLNLTPRMVK